MKRVITRRKGAEWCALEITHENDRLSICGSAGRVLPRAEAKKEALQSWENYFEDEPAEIVRLKCRTAKGAAKKVIASDGELHGLDVFRDDGKEVYILTSCGQIREELARFFPEAAPLLPWHLNDLRAGCEHQEALGWGHGVTIALAARDLTDAQRETLQAKAEAVAKKAREKEFARRWSELTHDRGKAVSWIKSIQGGKCSTDDVEAIVPNFAPGIYPSLTRNFKKKLEAQIEAEIKAEPFDAAIYKDSIGAPCPVCGYEYGTQWLKRDLPAEIVELAANVCKGEEAPAK